MPGKNKATYIGAMVVLLLLESCVFWCYYIANCIPTNGHLKNTDNLYAYLISLCSIRITGNCDFSDCNIETFIVLKRFGLRALFS